MSMNTLRHLFKISLRQTRHKKIHFLPLEEYVKNEN